ncbi:hypothetical protein [Streptomyces youssoufiensis]
MTAPSPADPAAIALELERLRRSVEVGFTKTDGSLALLVQRSDQTEAQLKDHDQRITVLERGRWPLPSLAALTGVAGLVIGLYGLLGK